MTLTYLFGNPWEAMCPFHLRWLRRVEPGYCESFDSMRHDELDVVD